MSRKHWKSFITLWLIAAILCTSASAQKNTKSKQEPMVIQEQGSFAVGGTVITAPGTFDPIKQGAYNPAGTDPAGQTLHGDHVYASPSITATTFPISRVTIQARSSGGSFLRWPRSGENAVNKQGGNVTLVHLPEIGVRGKTNFPMSDMNNLEIANLMARFLKEKSLD